MAADTEPLEILLHLPLLAEDKILPLAQYLLHKLDNASVIDCFDTTEETVFPNCRVKALHSVIHEKPHMFQCPALTASTGIRESSDANMTDVLPRSELNEDLNENTSSAPKTQQIAPDSTKEEEKIRPTTLEASISPISQFALFLASFFVAYCLIVT